MMGKRPCHMIVISSSDEEDSNSNKCLSKFAVHNSKSIGNAARKKLKDGRGCSGTGIPLPKVSLLGAEDWATILPETFSDNLSLEQTDAVPKNKNQRPRLAQRAETDLWAEKYRPRALTELAVHRKKVAEVKAWLEGQLNGSMEHFGSRVLLLTGPSGVGKTATVRVLADLLGIELCEWQTPTPTLWREYVHHVNSGISYVSKLDEFESFIETIRKYPVLPMGSSSAARRLKKTMAILVDDLPIPNSGEACQRLCQCFNTLALSSQFPTIVLISEFGEGSDKGGQSRMIREFQLALEQGGATKIVFNPLTAKSITKALTKIWTEEFRTMPPEWLSYISESSGGDIRQAVASLQFCCLGQDSKIRDLGGAEHSGSSKAKSRKLSEKEVVLSSQSSFTCIEYANKAKLMTCMARDGILSLFHALGKFLHNKRQTDQVSDSGQGFPVLQEKFLRYPLKMGVPEIVLSQAHAEAGTFLAFLHENVLDFIGDEAIDDAWIAASYFSDSDFLLGASGSRPTRHRALCDGDDFDSQHIAEAAARSIASRGVLFANSHPAPPRWHSIRGPRLWQVEHVSHQKRNEIFSEQRANGGLFRCHDLSLLATEYKPILQWLAASDCHGSLESFSSCKQQWEAGNIETNEFDSVELEDFLRFSNDNISTTSNSDIGHAYFNNFVNEVPGEIDEDEIEDC